MNLRTKILLSSGLPLFVVLVTVAAFLLYDLYTSRVAAAEDELRSAANEAALRIDAVNRHSADIAAMMATAQAYGMFSDRRRSIEFARGVLENTPDITGAYFGYEPGADGDSPEGDGIDPRALGADRRFLPYWFRGIEDPDEIALTPLVDMETSYYYQGVENLVRKNPEGMGVTLPGGVSDLYR